MKEYYRRKKLLDSYDVNKRFTEERWDKFSEKEQYFNSQLKDFKNFKERSIKQKKDLETRLTKIESEIRKTTFSLESLIKQSSTILSDSIKGTFTKGATLFENLDSSSLTKNKTDNNQFKIKELPTFEEQSIEELLNPFTRASASSFGLSSTGNGTNQQLLNEHRQKVISSSSSLASKKSNDFSEQDNKEKNHLEQAEQTKDSSGITDYFAQQM